MIQHFPFKFHWHCFRNGPLDFQFFASKVFEFLLCEFVLSNMSLIEFIFLQEVKSNISIIASIVFSRYDCASETILMKSMFNNIHIWTLNTFVLKET